MFESKEGQYKYEPHYNVWRISRQTNGQSEKVKDVATMEEARDFVYGMNGWGRPPKRRKAKPTQAPRSASIPLFAGCGKIVIK